MGLAPPHRHCRARLLYDAISGVMTVLVQKQRQGPAPLAVDLWCDLATTRFGELAKDRSP